MTFECIGCGLCCRHLSRALSNEAPLPWMQIAIDEFPYKVDEDGACEKLDGNQCSVYEDRPLLCNLEKLLEESETEMTKATWYTANAMGCNVLLEDAGWADRVLVNYKESATCQPH